MAYPQLLGNGKDIADLAFAGQVPPHLLLILFVLRPLASAPCLGSGVPGGLFTPSLAMEACSMSVRSTRRVFPTARLRTCGACVSPPPFRRLRSCCATTSRATGANDDSNASLGSASEMS
ncbi:MAG: chloride channel protein [Steroidobacteraceae bacterium]